MKSKKLALILFTVMLYTACTRTEKPADSRGNESADALVKRTEALQDSIDLYWDKMIRSDDEKIENVKLLLDELAYSKHYDKQKLADMYNLQASMKEKRYNHEDLQTKENVFKYDQVTDSLMAGINQLSETAPNKEKNPRIDLLLSYIRAADDSALLYRVSYDKQVKEFNKYAKENKKQLKKLGQPYASLEQKPMFQLAN